MFAEGAARVVARIADRRACAAASSPAAYAGRGSCYIEFGAGRVGRVDVDFLSGPKPTGTFHEPSAALRAEKDISARAGAPAGSDAESPLRYREPMLLITGGEAKGSTNAKILRRLYRRSSDSGTTPSGTRPGDERRRNRTSPGTAMDTATR